VPGVDSLLRGAPALDAALGELAGRLRQVTVQVQAGGRSAGAGVVWLRGGLVVTNAHVATGIARSCHKISNQQTHHDRNEGRHDAEHEGIEQCTSGLRQSSREMLERESVVDSKELRGGSRNDGSVLQDDNKRDAADQQ